MVTVKRSDDDGGGEDGKTQSSKILLDPIPRTGNRVRTVSHATDPNGVNMDSYRMFVGDDMDQYLDKIGLVRRAMPDDGNSLYRALAEELSLHQAETVYMSLRKIIDEEVEMRYKFQRIDKGSIEIDKMFDMLTAAARLFKLTIKVYKGPNSPQVYSSGNSGCDSEKEVLLYQSNRGGGYFERIYRKSLQIPLAISQSLLYSSLYKDVFGLSDDAIDYAIKHVRSDIDSSGQDHSMIRTPSPLSSFQTSNNAFNFANISGDADKAKSVQTYPNYRPPIPYSAVKSLDPAIYRNVSFDLFSKDKRDLEMMRQTTSLRFPVGSPCIARDGREIRKVKVIAVVSEDLRLVRFDDGEQRTMAVSDLRAQQITSYLVPPPTGPPRPLMSSSVLDGMMTPKMPRTNEQVFARPNGRSSSFSQQQRTSASQPYHVPLPVTISPLPSAPMFSSVFPSPLMHAPPMNTHPMSLPIGINSPAPYQYHMPSVMEPTTWWRPVGTPPVANSEIDYRVGTPSMLIPPPPAAFLMGPSPSHMLTAGPSGISIMGSPHLNNSIGSSYSPNGFHHGHLVTPGSGQYAGAIENLHYGYAPIIHSTPLRSNLLPDETSPKCCERDSSDSVFVCADNGDTKMLLAPFISSDTYCQVNDTVEASRLPDGSDLPKDMLTLRYFFNLGVKTHRNSSESNFPITPASIARFDCGGAETLSQETEDTNNTHVSIPPASSIPQPTFSNGSYMYQSVPQMSLLHNQDMSQPPPSINQSQMTSVTQQFLQSGSSSEMSTVQSFQNNGTVYFMAHTEHNQRF